MKKVIIALVLIAVAAGLASQATLLVVVLTAIASFSGPNYNIGLTWRILKFLLIFAAAFLGLYGLTLGGLAVLAHAAIQNSFGVSYLSPWAPPHVREMGDTIIRRPIWLRRRPATYHPLDEVRYKEADPKQDED